MVVVLNRVSPWICIIWWHCWCAHRGLCQVQKGEALIPWQGAETAMKTLLRQDDSKFYLFCLHSFFCPSCAKHTLCIENYDTYLICVHTPSKPTWSNQILSLFTLAKSSARSSRQNKAIDKCRSPPPKQTPFMSAVVLQWLSFFRHHWCQGSGMAASLWWETVAHVLCWLPSFGIIGEEGVGRERVGSGGSTERGPFKPCEIVLSVVGMIFIPFPPFLRLRALALSISFCFSHSLSSSFSPFHPPPEPLPLSLPSLCLFML